MGTIEIERTTSLAEEIAAEQCVGEGGHFFEREGERDDEGNFLVYCDRCSAEGWETPDPEDRPGPQTGRFNAALPNLSQPPEKPGGFCGPGITWTGPGGLDS